MIKTVGRTALVAILAILASTAVSTLIIPEAYALTLIIQPVDKETGRPVVNATAIVGEKTVRDTAGSGTMQIEYDGSGTQFLLVIATGYYAYNVKLPTATGDLVLQPAMSKIPQSKSRIPFLPGQGFPLDLSKDEILKLLPVDIILKYIPFDRIPNITKEDLLKYIPPEVLAKYVQTKEVLAGGVEEGRRLAAGAFDNPRSTLGSIAIVFVVFIVAAYAIDVIRKPRRRKRR